MTDLDTPPAGAALSHVDESFAFEGTQRQRIAEEAIIKMRDKVDALVVIPNDRIFSVISKDTPILKAFEAIDEVMRNALQGLVELILTPGIVNVDFADVRAIMQDAGSAIVGVGHATGPERAVAALRTALRAAATACRTRPPPSAVEPVPWCAISNLPGLRATAPVKAPFSCPKSSVSSSVSGIAAQLIATNGIDDRSLSA